MDYSNLVWLPPVGIFAYLAARIVIDDRRLEQELEDRRYAGLKDMVESWCQSRMQHAVPETLTGADYYTPTLTKTFLEI